MKLKRDVDDAITHFSYNINAHLDLPVESIEVDVFDFLSALDTIRTHPLCGKPLNVKVGLSFDS